jgi:hypothetical protein
MGQARKLSVLSPTLFSLFPQSKRRRQVASSVPWMLSPDLLNLESVGGATADDSLLELFLQVSGASAALVHATRMLGNDLQEMEVCKQKIYVFGFLLN